MPPPAGPCVPIWGLRAAHAPCFWGHQAPRAMVALWLHASCPKTAKPRKINQKMPKNSQPQGPSGKEVLTPATNCKNQPAEKVFSHLQKHIFHSLQTFGFFNRLQKFWILDRLKSFTVHMVCLFNGLLGILLQSMCTIQASTGTAWVLYSTDDKFTCIRL